MNNKESFFIEKAKKDKCDREAFIVSQSTRKLMTFVNDASIGNTKLKRLELLLATIMEYFDEFDTQIFVETFLNSEGLLSLKSIIEFKPTNRALKSIITSLTLCIKLTRYDNDIRVMMYNLGFITILTNLCCSCIHSFVYEKAASLFSELSIITPDVFVTSNFMLNDIDTIYGHETKNNGESIPLIPKSILYLYRAQSLEVKRSAIILSLTLWSSNSLAVDNLKQVDSGKWLYKTLPHIFRVMLNQHKDENNRVELVTLSRHEAAELIVYFYADPTLQSEVLRYLVSLILLHTLDSDTPNFLNSVPGSHDQQDQVQSLSSELDNNNNTIGKILDTTIVMISYTFRQILQLSEDKLREQQSPPSSDQTSPRSPKSPRSPCTQSLLSPRSKAKSTKSSTLVKNSHSQNTKSLPSYSKLAIEDELQPVRASKLHLAFFCLIVTITYNFNNNTWRKSDDPNILKDGIVSRLINTLQLWLMVDNDCNFDIKKYFILLNISIVDYGPIECIDLLSSLEEIVLSDNETIMKIIEMLKHDIGFAIYMKDFKRCIYDEIKQEHSTTKTDIDDYDHADEDNLKDDIHSEADLKEKDNKPTTQGYRVLMKVLGLNSNVMENHLDVMAIDESKMTKLVSTIRPDVKRKQMISPRGSPLTTQLERKAMMKSGFKKTDIDDDGDDDKYINSPSPTFKLPKFDPNQSISNVQDDEEIMSQMTNVEKIMFQIKNQLEIVELYTTASSLNSNIDNISDNNSRKENEVIVKANRKKQFSHTHKIKLPENEEEIAQIVTTKQMKNLKKFNSSLLFQLCEKEFLS